MGKAEVIDFPKINEEEIFKFSDILKTKIQSQEDYYRVKYNMYYYGSEHGYLDRALANVVYGTINQYLSLVFTGDDIILEPRLNNSLEHTQVKDFINEIVENLADTILEDFQNTKSNLALKHIVLDGLVAKNGFGKIIVSSGNWKTPYIVRINPFNIAVAYSGFDIQDEQQIILHRTYLTKETFKFKYPSSADKVFQNILEMKRKQDEMDNDAFNTAVQIAPVSMSHGVYQTNPEFGVNSAELNTPVDDLIEIFEYWYYDYKIKRWIEVQHSNKVILLTRQHLINPFFTIVPLRYAGNEYGFSMINLVDKIQRRISDIYERVNDAGELLAQPPVLISGFGVNAEEAFKIEKVIRTPGGSYILDGNNISFKPYEVGLQPQVSLEEKNQIEQDAQKVMSMTSIMQGVPASNVRSASYAQILSQFSSAPLKMVAVEIEKQVEDVFNLLAEIYINDSTVSYKGKNGNTYTFSNLKLTDWGRIVIYANSTSPIIKDSNEALLLNLAQEGIIPKEVLVKVLQIPFKDEIKKHLKEMKMIEQITQSKEQQPQQQPRKEEKKK